MRLHLAVLVGLNWLVRAGFTYPYHGKVKRGKLSTCIRQQQ
jgi:hypothetical protein